MDWQIGTLTGAETQFIDIRVPRFVVMAIWPEPKADPLPTAPSLYRTPYLDLLERAITEWRITEDHQPKKDNLLDWFMEQTVEGEKLSENLASAMATLVRMPASQRGGAKRIGAALIAGDPLISIDNCEAGLGGELLCQALTQPMLKVRLLGKSINIEVPSSATMFATGNNLTMVGDMTRRALRCTLDAGVERPELRAFDRDPLAILAANRGDHLAAVLTILRAHHLAGRPQQSTPLGSFTEWSGWVRDSLIWLGEADPCTTMEQIRCADPKLESLTTVIEQWHTYLGTRRVSVKDVIDVATDQHSSFHGRAEFINPDFRESLLAVAGDGGAISGRRLGKWLAANQGRIVHGMRLVADGMVSGIARWRLVEQDAKSIEGVSAVSNIRPFPHHVG